MPSSYTNKGSVLKPYKIATAVHWLGKFWLKRQGLLSYVNPYVYVEQHCRDIIEHSTDEEIVALGLDVAEARSLARRRDGTSDNREG